MRRLLRRLRREERGAVTLIFALVSVFVLVPAVLISVDAYVAVSQKDRLQDALDAATLFAARSSADEDAELQVLGEKALKANLEIIGGEPAKLISSSFTISDNNAVVTGAATVQPKTFFNWCHEWDSDVFCWAGGPIRSTAEVERGLQTVEIALVLDNTGSMQTGTRMGTLRTSSRKMVDTLKDAAEETGQSASLKFSLVPFSNTVRVQASNDLDDYSGAVGGASGIPTWVDPRGRAHAAVGQEIFSVTQTDRLLTMKAVGEGWDGCIESRRPPFDVVETAANSTIPASMFVPYFWPDEPDPPQANKDWSDRNDYLEDDTNSSAFFTRAKNMGKYDKNADNGVFNMQSGFGGPYRLGPNAGCNLEPVVRLTNSWPTIKNAINGMHPIGETNITVGLMWGWHTLSPIGPFGDGVAYDTPRSKKIIVLMTDGENTFYDPTWLTNDDHRSFYSGQGYVWQRTLPTNNTLTAWATGGTSLALRRTYMDQRLQLLCNNIKAQNIIIYTVLLEVPNPASNVVENCATEPGKFYDVDDEKDLEAAFDAIAEDIKALRIMR